MAQTGKRSLLVVETAQFETSWFVRKSLFGNSSSFLNYLQKICSVYSIVIIIIEIMEQMYFHQHIYNIHYTL